jgi:hypothetical protein
LVIVQDTPTWPEDAVVFHHLLGAEDLTMIRKCGLARLNQVFGEVAEDIRHDTPPPLI